MLRLSLMIWTLVVALLVAGCAAGQLSVVPTPATDTPAPSTATPIPATATAEPTPTPVPATSTPSATLAPPTSTPQPTATPMPPTATPIPPLTASGGGVLAFSSDRSGRPGIWVMNADGTDKRMVTDEENPKNASISPDGARLAYIASAPNIGRVYTIGIDGGDRQEIYAENRAMGEPDWSPDGTQIAFVLHTHQYFSVSVVHLETGRPRELTLKSSEEINASPGWSPDGQRIVFTSDRDGDPEIYIMQADGSKVQQMTDNDSNDWWPDWSPDGSQILFTSNRDGNYEIYVMDTDGSNVRRLTDDPANDREAKWSPDGTRIAFSSKRDYNWDIYLMNADGSDLQRLTTDKAQDTFPAWRPD